MSPHWVNAPHQEQAPITEMSTSCFKKGKILFLFSSNPPGLHLPVLHFSSDVEEEVRGTSTLEYVVDDDQGALVKMALMSEPHLLGVGGDVDALDGDQPGKDGIDERTPSPWCWW